MVTACCCIFKSRCFFLFLCYVQLITLIARQTFDFFGHLWLCILMNFLTILIVIIGIFGGHQYRPGYISIYLLWQIINVTWNVFIICFYLDIGPYTLITGGDYNLVNLGTGGRSWFEANGPLCNAIYNVSDLTDHLQLIKPVQVNGCYLDYRIIECLQAGIQILLAINSFFISFVLVYSFSRKPYFAVNNQYSHNGNSISGHNNNFDSALPPYTISNSTTTRANAVHRSIRSVHSDTLRKQTNRSSTRSTKSHRAARKNKLVSQQPPSYKNSNQNEPVNHYPTNNTYNTLNSNSNNHNNNIYNTYKSIRSYGTNQNSNNFNSKQYNSTTQLQPDNSSLDSLTLYGAQTNAGYYESRYSLHESKKEPYPSTSSQNISVSNANNQRSNYNYDMNTSNYNNISCNSNYESNLNQSNQNNYYQQNYKNQNQDSFYNVYSSNPYNTYGRSATRHQQRPSSFCSNSSINSNTLLDNNLINNNPNGNQHQAHSYNNTNLRGSPIYMNSETRI